MKKNDTRQRPRVQQSFRDQCNIKSKMEQLVPSMRQRPYHEKNNVIFTDLSQNYDFHEMQNLIIRANMEFMKIPARIRAMFNHDAGNFWNFVKDPKNRDKCIELGIIKANDKDLERLRVKNANQAIEAAKKAGVNPEELMSENEKTEYRDTKKKKSVTPAQ